MDLKGLLSKDIKVGKPGSGRFPSKRTINFMEQEGQTYSKAGLIAGFVIFLILLALFTKFMVVDQLNRLDRAESEYQKQEAVLQDLKDSNAGYDDAQGQYSRYGFSYMTNDELSLHDREDMLNTINDVLGNSVTLESVTLGSGGSSSSDSSSGGGSGSNTATVRIQCGSMRTVSSLVTTLNSCENVSGASATQVDKGSDYTTSSDGTVSASDTVVADLTINFKSPVENTDSKDSDDKESISGQLKDQTQRFNEAEEQGADE